MESVVELREIEAGIVQITMQDRVHKNSFSYEFVRELIKRFETIQDNANYKAVVLTGYDSYFATGGTQEALIETYEGNINFNDTNFYSLALDCKIPVIAAMQGHGIGGGFALGLFADFVVMSRESVYSTNFMKYGFTPGMGATYIIPKKLGFSLGEELLLNAGVYRGAELEKRGIPFPVLPREKVLPYALDIARQLAEKPRHSLVTLKDHLVAPIREKLPGIIAKEVEMHDKTFHRPEVRERIVNLFGK